MHFIHYLVYVTLLMMQCHSQVQNDRPYHSIQSQDGLVYRINIDSNGQDSLRQERQLPLYKVSRYQGGSSPVSYQFQPDSNYASFERQPEESHQYQTNYDGVNHISQQQVKKQQLPAVEQYLKEVTPTTKTAYNSAAYGQYSPQPVVQTIDSQSSILKQSSPFQYVLQPELQPSPLPIQHPKKVQSQASQTNQLAYQNAFLAQQNALYEEQRAAQILNQQQNVPPKSAIYVSQKIPQKPVVRKITKPKPIANEDDVDFYVRLQQYQQQLQQQKQSDVVFEVKQPAPPKFQAKLTQYSKPETQEQIYQYQTSVSEPKYQQTVRYQPVQSSEPATYQNVESPAYRYQSIASKQPEQQIQYQPQAVPLREGPKFLTEQNYVPRYQQTETSGASHVSYEQSGQSALEKYRAAIASYQSQQNNYKIKAEQPVTPQYGQEQTSQIRYQPQQPQQPQQQAQPQYEEESQQDEQSKPTSEYIKSLGKNSSLRLYKGRPVVFIGQEE